MAKYVIVDVSPVLYGALFSETSQQQRRGAKPQEDGKLEYTEEYQKNVEFKILEELSNDKAFFSADHVILAFDNSQGGYWRKNYYDRYKYGRSKGRDDSVIPWNKAFETFNKLREFFEKDTQFITMYPAHCEADDVAFVLSKELTKQGHQVVVKSLDHDWEHCLNYEGCEVFKTRKTQRLPGIYVQKTKEELEEDIQKHKVIGDSGDGFLHIKSWTQFSPEFLEEYPKYKGKEQELYHKHHEIEKMFDEKHNFEKSAYKHPRFGWKSFVKSKKTLKDILEENPIHQMNYERNEKLALPTAIPDEIVERILQNFEQNKNATSNKAQITKFLMSVSFELMDKLNRF